MKKQVTVVDYGLGNLFSVGRALAVVGAEVNVTWRPEAIRSADRLVLPGVGAFGDGMERLRERELLEPLAQFAKSGRPLLGICLGMQLLFSESEEFGRHEGLGLIAGSVLRLSEVDEDGQRVKVPHVGWSELERPGLGADWDSTFLDGLADAESMYFVHSYVPFPERETLILARFTYGGRSYCAAIEENNLMGIQCHPEKSGHVGLRVLSNFLNR